MLTNSFNKIILFCCVCTIFSGCASKVGDNGLTLEEQVQQQDMQLKQLQPAQADTWNQLQILRQEVDDLKGQIDDLKNAGGARALLNKVNRHEAALKQIENTMALNLNLTSDASETQNNASPNPAPQAVATAKPSEEQTTSKTSDNWGKATPKPAPAPAPTKDLAQALYDDGVKSYKARSYLNAQNSFADFIKNYSKHKLAADAQYYLGECYFQRNRFSDAILAYNDVITKYSKSARVPGAYLKQGISFSKNGQKDAAKVRLNELIKKYPTSSEATRAKSFLKTNM